MNKKNTILLSVRLMTYNHEAYILDALKGIDIQKTNFPFEVVIGDDFSNDNTLEIIKKFEFENKNITPVILKRNKGDAYHLKRQQLGRIYNFINILNNCNGEYIALLDGDDFWTDPLKLQKQVNFLESNPDYEVCFTNIKIVNEDNEVVKDRLINDNRRTTHLHKDLPIWAPTLTRVFRNRDFKDLPVAPGLDNIMLLYQSKFGKIKCINEITGTYRVHDSGVYSALSLAKKREHLLLTDIASLPLIDASLFPKYFGMIFKRLVELKPLDYQLFIKNRKLFLSRYKEYRDSFSLIMKLKCTISFFFMSLPFIKNSDLCTKYILKILNRFFIY